MSHLPILPVLLPAFAGFLLVFMARSSLTAQRTVALAATGAGLLLAVVAFGAALDGTPRVYRLGDWPAPFGIVLVLDRLSALMVLLTAIAAAGALLAAIRDWDRQGPLFHALFQLQLMGIYGAFLTGDIFNLFVFFEILLIASYGLLLHGRGPDRVRAGIKYVVVNLSASSLFLVGVGILYGVTGTLNMADLAIKVAEADPADLGLIRASALILLVVFGTKAALLPLMFWLPDAYAATTPPVAGLFAIMTKIGVYAIVRVYTIAFGGMDGGAGAIIEPWLLVIALATLVVGTLGALAADTLRRMIGYLTIASIGTMLVGIALFTTDALAGGLYYLAHSTLVVAGLFLLAAPITRARADDGDRLLPGPPLTRWAWLGLLYMGLAVGMAGLPPLSGFLGKALILQSAAGHANNALIWSVILVTSLFFVVALSRAGSVLFWKTRDEAAGGPPVRGGDLVPAIGLAAALVALTLFAGPFDRFTRAIANDLLQPGPYIEAVLSTPEEA